MKEFLVRGTWGRREEEDGLAGAEVIALCDQGPPTMKERRGRE